jgi:hypothetical protein
MKINTRDMIAGGALVLVAVLGYYFNLDHTLGNARRMGPGYMPMMAFVLLGGLGLTVMGLALFSGPNPLDKWTKLEVIAVPSALVAFFVVSAAAGALGATGWYPLGFGLLGACLTLSMAQGWQPIGLVHAGLATFGLMLETFGLIVSLIVTLIVASFAERTHTVKGVIGMIVFLCVLCWWIFIKELDIRVPLWPTFLTQ